MTETERRNRRIELDRMRRTVSDVRLELRAISVLTWKLNELLRPIQTDLDREYRKTLARKGGKR